jgi:hypothetical protein
MAYFHKAFVFEFIDDQLTIEGVPVNDVVDCRDFEKLPTGARSTLIKHVQTYIENSEAFKDREGTKEAHLKELRHGKDAWNEWRGKNRHIMPIFANHDFTKDERDTRLDGYDFSYTNFTQAMMKNVSLTGASFHQAILAAADLTDAHLEHSNFCRTDFYETIFTNAHLNGANLQGVQLARTKLAGTDLRTCQIYGLSAWDLEMTADTKQEGLVIHYEELIGGDRNARTATANSLDLASLMYLALNNHNIARVIEAATEQWVLLLGRFTNGGKEPLLALSDALESRNRIPIVFDFERARARDLIETIVLLAGLSGFVVVDISDPRSTPLELYAIAPHFAVPVIPVMQTGTRPFSLFSGLAKFPWVQTPIEYADTLDLIAKLDTSILPVAAAEANRQSRFKKAQP